MELLGVQWRYPTFRHWHACLCKRGLKKHKAQEGSREKGTPSIQTEHSLPLTLSEWGRQGYVLSVQQHRRRGPARMEASCVVWLAALTVQMESSCVVWLAALTVQMWDLQTCRTLLWCQLHRNSCRLCRNPCPPQDAISALRAE